MGVDQTFMQILASPVSTGCNLSQDIILTISTRHVESTSRNQSPAARRKPSLEIEYSIKFESLSNAYNVYMT